MTIQDIFSHTRLFFRDPVYCLEVLKSAAFFAAALILNYFAVRWATATAGPAVPDLLLDWLPMRDTRVIDYYGTLYLEYAVLFYALVQAGRLPFFLKALTALIVTRALFINLTHLGIPAGAEPTISFFTQGGDLFFSGHVALPFLAALVYWEFRKIRLIFLVGTLIMAGEVLLGHQHYSIDVLAAPFITYGIYRLVSKMFVRDFSLKK